MMFSDLTKALSVKSCYSKWVLSSAVFLLTLLLSATLFFHELPRSEREDMSTENAAFLE
ncbi:hypothetical protein [Sneathiella litorea]|nr:hypothetical protein [Sneathiella litorea]